MKLISLVLALVCVALAGCGGQDNASSSSSQSANDQVIKSAEAEDVSDQQVADAFGEKFDEQDSFDFKAANGDDCSMVIVLHGKQQIELYRNAGDTVLVNPAGSVGVKIVPFGGSSSEACAKAAADALEKL
ncbi:MAG: hypothetical protein ACRDKE_09855 [Solirubrobacterales bacterium]